MFLFVCCFFHLWFIYTPMPQTVMVCRLWNYQSAVQKADLITDLTSFPSLNFMALTENWITLENSATPAAVLCLYFLTCYMRNWQGKWYRLASHRNGTLQFLHCSSEMSHHINSMLLLNSVIHKAPLGIFIEELNIFLSFFPADVTLTTYL